MIGKIRLKPFSDVLIRIDGKADLKGSRFVVANSGNVIEIGKAKIIGTRIEMDSGCTLIVKDEAVIRGSRIYMSDEGSKIVCNEKFDGGSNLKMFCQEGKKILISADFMCSSDCEFRNSDAHPIYNTTGERINHAKDIIIGRHVWLGEKAVILKGVLLNDGAIVGHSTVMTGGEYEGNAIYAGIPGKKVKEGIRWSLS